MADSEGWAGILPDGAPPRIDTTVAHPARIYDYWLGGKNNFADLLRLDTEHSDEEVACFGAAVSRRRC